jgi:protoheme ferro-lyase
VQVYHTPLKAEVLAQQFERSLYLTLNMSTPHHTTTITRFVDRFFRDTYPHTTPLQLTDIYKVKQKILSLKLRSAPGNDGITP